MKMIKHSAGLLLYRLKDGVKEFFLVHPGGPFWAKKDAGAWSIPKGEFTEEDPLDAAKREFEEETGMHLKIDGGKPTPLTPVVLKSGKTVYAWAVEGDMDAALIKSNMFEMEWPPKSGKMMSVPEVDKAGWFAGAEAKQRINPAQAAFIDETERLINP